MALSDKFKTLHFLRSLSTTVAYYLVEAKIGSGDWTEIGRVFPAGNQWQFLRETADLTDLATYTWRITPVDAAGNPCETPTVIGPEKVVRTPDSIRFTASFNAGPSTVTISAA